VSNRLPGSTSSLKACDCIGKSDHNNLLITVAGSDLQRQPIPVTQLLPGMAAARANGLLSRTMICSAADLIEAKLERWSSFWPEPQLPAVSCGYSCRYFNGKFQRVGELSQ